MAAEHGAVIQADGFCQRRRVIVAEALLCRLAQRPHGAVSSAQTQLFHQRRRVRENPANGFVYVLQLVFLFPALADQLSSEQQEQEQLPETVTALKAAQSDTDEMVVDQEYRITMLELGVSDTDDTDNADNT